MKTENKGKRKYKRTKKNRKCTAVESECSPLLNTNTIDEQGINYCGQYETFVFEGTEASNVNFENKLIYRLMG